MNIISISTDRNVFKEGSPARARQLEYGSLFSETHLIIFSRKKTSTKKQVVENISPNVFVHPTNSLSRFLYFFDAYRTARKIIKERGFLPRNTVVTVQDPFETGIVGACIKKRFKLPLHVQIHTDFLSPYFRKFSLFNKLRVKIAKIVLPQADAVRTVSQRIADSLSRERDLNLKREVVPHILPLFADLNAHRTFSRTDANRETIRKEYPHHKEYPQFKFSILVISRLTKEKNITLAIESFSNFLKKLKNNNKFKDGNDLAINDIGLIIVGDGPEKPRLKSLVDKLWITNNVVFTGWQNPEAVRSFYASADLFLSTSWYEGFGLSMFEAFLAELPIVSTDAGIAVRLTDNICSPGDRDCLAEKIYGFYLKWRSENLAIDKNIKTQIANHDFDLNSFSSREFPVNSRAEYLQSYRESLCKALNPL